VKKITRPYYRTENSGSRFVERYRPEWQAILVNRLGRTAVAGGARRHRLDTGTEVYFQQRYHAGAPMLDSTGLMLAPVIATAQTRRKQSICRKSCTANTTGVRVTRTR
jgi:hypothetical protein